MNTKGRHNVSSAKSGQYWAKIVDREHPEILKDQAILSRGFIAPRFLADRSGTVDKASVLKTNVSPRLIGIDFANLPDGFTPLGVGVEYVISDVNFGPYDVPIRGDIVFSSIDATFSINIGLDIRDNAGDLVMGASTFFASALTHTVAIPSSTELLISSTDLTRRIFNIKTSTAPFNALDSKLSTSISPRLALVIQIVALPTTNTPAIAGNILVSTLR